MCTTNAMPYGGLGVTYLASRSKSMRDIADEADFFELDPESLCREIGLTEADPPRLQLCEQLTRETLEQIGARPWVVHGASLSLGSPSGFNDAYLDMLAELERLHSFVWHSEHLAFSWVDTAAGRRHIGSRLPLPLTVEAVQMVAARAVSIRERVRRPLLLENSMSWFADLPHDPDWDLAVFLNEVTHASGCGLLIDLDDFADYCWIHHVDPQSVLARVDLGRVEQVHVAGQAAGPTGERTLGEIEAVWDLLRWMMPRAPNLRGVVYELTEASLDDLGSASVQRDLRRIRTIVRASSGAIVCR